MRAGGEVLAPFGFMSVGLGGNARAARRRRATYDSVPLHVRWIWSFESGRSRVNW